MTCWTFTITHLGRAHLANAERNVHHHQSAKIRKAWREAGIQVLPGAYLSREVAGENPGRGYIRVALVAGESETEQALSRLKDVIYKEGR